MVPPVPYLQEAVRLNPELDGAPNELAMVCTARPPAGGGSWFQKSLSASRTTSAPDHLGLALTMTGKAKESLAIFHQALAETTKDAFIYKEHGRGACAAFRLRRGHCRLSSGDGDRSSGRPRSTMTSACLQIQRSRQRRHRRTDTRRRIGSYSTGSAVHAGYSLYADRQAGPGCG